MQNGLEKGEKREEEQKSTKSFRCHENQSLNSIFPLTHGG